MKPAFKKREFCEAGKLIDRMRYCKTCKQQTMTRVFFEDADIHYDISLYPEPDGQVGVNWHYPIVDSLGHWGKIVCSHCRSEKGIQLTDLLHGKVT